MVTSEKIERLEYLAGIEGTETGETATLLCALVNYSDYLSDDFVLALGNEIEGALEAFEEEFEVVERIETFTRTVVELKERTK